MNGSFGMHGFSTVIYSIVKLIVFTLCGCLLSACGSERPRENVLSANGAESVVVMDFSQPLSLDPITPGWFHRQFKRHEPMDISLVTKDEKPSIRLATNDTASMLFRMVDIPIDEYPTLSWDWLIEQGIDDARSHTTLPTVALKMSENG